MYSSIYILATGFSISMIMVLAIVFYLKVANIYPETGRDRMLIFRFAELIRENSSRTINRLSLEIIQKCIYSLQTAEAVTAIYELHGNVLVQPEITWIILAGMVMVAIWYPAYSVSRIKPVDALRDE